LASEERALEKLALAERSEDASLEMVRWTISFAFGDRSSRSIS
jgi:hypothetical protein